MRANILEFPQMGDARGNLVVIEGEQQIPFEIKRVFYLYGSDSSVIRGQHANRKSEFVLVNVNGTSKVRVRDGKGYDEVFCLNKPFGGLYIPKMMWKDMYEFSPDSILLILSSEHYDSGEYIKTYSDFKKEVNRNE
jgi:dTDP-4-dehydrorhamnose 3,5-epimerase-like enzyme